MSTLYETDFYSWTQEQAQVLRDAAAARPDEPAGLDWEHVAQEIWELGLSLENELYDRYVVLLCHLLRWRAQPRLRSGSWRGSISEQRFRIARLLRRHPSLRPVRAAELADAYPAARARALAETGLPDNAMPTDCPFALEQVEDEAFWDGAGADY
jgi:hypothetical protein